MNIEIKITAESVEEARAAFVQLAGERPATHITVIPNDPRYQGSELTIPAGTDLTIAGATRDGVTLTSDLTQEPMQKPESEPEKPKRSRKAKAEPEAPAREHQEAQGATEQPQPAAVAAEPEKPAESTPAPAEKPVTLDQITAAGAKLLDSDASVMPKLLALLGDFNVQAITQLRKDQLADFAVKLRELGAEV